MSKYAFLCIAIAYFIVDFIDVFIAGAQNGIGNHALQMALIGLGIYAILDRLESK